VKPEDKAAYYVVNSDFSDKIELWLRKNRKSAAFTTVQPTALALNDKEVRSLLAFLIPLTRIFAEQMEENRAEERNTIINNMRKVGSTEEQIR
jgi:hypothetical protein